MSCFSLLGTRLDLSLMRSAMQSAGQKFAAQPRTASHCLARLQAYLIVKLWRPLPSALKNRSRPPLGGKGEGQNTHFLTASDFLPRSAPLYPPERVKLTWTCVSTSTGSPFSR